MAPWTLLLRCKSLLEYVGGSQARDPTLASGLGSGWRSMGDLAKTPGYGRLVERLDRPVGQRLYWTISCRTDIG